MFLHLYLPLFKKKNKLQKKVMGIRKLKDSHYHVQRKTDEKTMFYHTVKGTSLKNRV